MPVRPPRATPLLPRPSGRAPRPSRRRTGGRAPMAAPPPPDRSPADGGGGKKERGARRRSPPPPPAADRLLRSQHQRRMPRLRQGDRGGETVRARADDDGVGSA